MVQSIFVFFSPPYADLKGDDYETVSEKDYPFWFAWVMSELWPKLKENGNVVVIIESRVREGSESRYVNHCIDAVCGPENWNRKKYTHVPKGTSNSGSVIPAPPTIMNEKHGTGASE